MTQKLIFGSVCLAAFLVSLVKAGDCDMDRSFLQQELDKDRFQGKWYMTSWYYHGTGNGKAPLLENVQTIYTLRKDGNWNITYGVGILDGMCYKTPVEAMVDKNSEMMFWVFNFHLHGILATDYENYAVLHQCLDGMEYCMQESTQLAILSRRPEQDTASQDLIDKEVQNACIDLNDVVKVDHLKNCLCGDDVAHGLTEACDLE